jgi:hypothetical protein
MEYVPLTRPSWVQGHSLVALIVAVAVMVQWVYVWKAGMRVGWPGKAIPWRTDL